MQSESLNFIQRKFDVTLLHRIMFRYSMDDDFLTFEHFNVLNCLQPDQGNTFYLFRLLKIKFVFFTLEVLKEFWFDPIVRMAKKSGFVYYIRYVLGSFLLGCLMHSKKLLVSLKHPFLLDTKKNIKRGV